MGYVAGVAMEEEQSMAGVFARNEPAVQVQPVLGLKIHFLEGETDPLRRCEQASRGHIGEIDQARLHEVNQHGQAGIEANPDKQKFPDGVYWRSMDFAMAQTVYPFRPPNPAARSRQAPPVLVQPGLLTFPRARPIDV